MNVEGCAEGNLLRFEAVRQATLAAGLLMLSLVHKQAHLELLNMIVHFVVIQDLANDMHQRLETTLHPGDRGHNTLHGATECFLPWVVHSHIVRSLAAERRCDG